MNFSSFTKIALATAAMSFSASVAHSEVCPRLNDAVDLSRLSVDPNGKGYNCNYTPDGMRLKVQNHALRTIAKRDKLQHKL